MNFKVKSVDKIKVQDDDIRQCNGCYLRHADAQKAASSCEYCFAGQIIKPNTLVLPPVWTGRNALSVFTAMSKLSLDAIAHNELIIDFSDVTQIDSSGLGALVGLRKKLMGHDIKIHITGASCLVKRLMQTANLERIFVID